MSRVPFQLLELTIISAQDLAPLSKNLRTYAVTWVNPERKLRTRIDQQGQINPTWNDKFVFRVDDKFLNSDTSSVMVEIYALGWLRDTHVGSVRVLISNLIPPSVRRENRSSRRFVALQIRRPSGRPQGIINVGVTLLDNTMRSMPLYTQLSASAVGFHDLMGDEKLCKKKDKNATNHPDEKYDHDDDENNIKVQLRRSLSDQTDVTRKQESGSTKKGAPPVRNGSTINYDQGSMLNGDSVLNRGGSVLNGGGSVLNRGGSVLNGGGSMLNGGGGSMVGGSMVNGSMCYSDVGPSASVVAAAVARGLYPRQLGPPPKPGSSMLEDWTMEEPSEEGLKSKIERWRTEMPPIYDHRYRRLETGSGKEKKQTRRRRKTAGDGDGSGLFSCFGNAYGCEFTIVCGTNNGGTKNKARSNYSDSKISA